MKRIFFLATTIICSLSLNAQNNESELMARIKEKNSSYSSIYSRYTQVRHIPLLNKDITSVGTFYYAKPDRMMLAFDTPKGDLMLMDKDRFTMVDNGQMRRTTSRASEVMRKMKAIMTAAFEGDITRLDASEIKEVSAPKLYKFEVQMNNPEGGKGAVQVILTYNQSDLSIESIRMIEADGSYQEYTFTEKQLNHPIDSKVFQIKK